MFKTIKKRGGGSRSGRLFKCVCTVSMPRKGGWSSSVQVPTFYVEAFNLKEAGRVARHVCDPFADGVVSIGVVNDQEDYESFVFEAGKK